MARKKCWRAFGGISISKGKFGKEVKSPQCETRDSKMKEGRPMEIARVSYNAMWAAALRKWS